MRGWFSIILCGAACLGFVATDSVHAQEDPVAPARARYQEADKALATDADAQRAMLLESYARGINKLVADAQAAGDLDRLLAITPQEANASFGRVLLSDNRC